jgi:hypothetical protein
VEQFDVNTNELVIVTFDAGKLVRYVLPVMIRHLDVATLDDDVHAYLHAVAMVAPERLPAR